jgi:hypothetical protein
LSAKALYLLAAPSTPDDVREAVAERSERGELTHAEVKKMIAEAAAKDYIPQNEPQIYAALCCRVPIPI